MTANVRHYQSRPTLKPDSTLHIYYFAGTFSRNMTIDHPEFIGNWEEDGFSFLFFLEPAPKAIDAILCDAPHTKLLDQYEMTYKDWQGGDLEPLRIGRFLFIPPG